MVSDGNPRKQRSTNSYPGKGCHNAMDGQEREREGRERGEDVRLYSLSRSPHEPSSQTLNGSLNTLDVLGRSIQQTPPLSQVNHRTLVLQAKGDLFLAVGEGIEVLGEGDGFLGGDLSGRGQTGTVLDDGVVTDGEDVLEGLTGRRVNDAQGVAGVEPEKTHTKIWLADRKKDEIR